MKQRKIVLSMMVAILLVLSFSITAFAAGNTVDFNRTGSIRITLKDSTSEHKVIKGASFKLYQIALASSEDNNLAFTFTSDFQNCGISIDDLQAEGIAQKLAIYAKEKNISAVSGFASENGTVTFSSLKLGLYLAVQNGSITGYYAASPFLISVPMSSVDGTEWLYDIDASPKVQIRPEDKLDTTTEVTVTKVWESTGDSNRPKSVTVELYNGDVLYASVTLNAANSWTHTWRELPESSQWNVKETNVPKYYRVSYSVKGVTVVVTNTFDPKMIQTGQLNWPVPVLAGAGMVMFIVGWRLNYAKRKKEDA